MTPERRNSLLRHLTRELTQMAASTGWGPDMDWIASDRDGHLAVLATAGLGAIPARVTGDPAGLVAVIEEVENLKGFEIDFEQYVREPAQFGAFGFDYRDGKRAMAQYEAGHPYQRTGQIPADPLTIDSFGADAASYLSDVRFADVCFRQSSEIVVENAFSDIHRPTDWDRWSRPELLRPVAPRPEPPADELA
jgi:hypothetical protein